MRFRKYHGTGNDFVMLTDLEARMGPASSLAPELVAALCDRHTGIGADGVIRVIGPQADPATAEARAVARMDYYNADGAPAEMCGNGIRCLAVHEHRAGRLEEGGHVVLTGAGPVGVELAGPKRVTVNMGEPALVLETVPMNGGRGASLRATIDLDGEAITGTGVSMGNPHFVVFVDDIPRALDDELVCGLGPRIEHHGDFPERTNVEFVEVASATRLRMRVWERGVGETMACGSGACAAAVAGAALERNGAHVVIEMRGGELEVEWLEGNGVLLTGEAEEVFAGEVDTDWLRARDLVEYANLVAL